MSPEESARLGKVAVLLRNLLDGEFAEPIELDDEPRDELRDVTELVNDLARHLGEVQSGLVPLANGRLDVHFSRGNFLASPFKQLHNSLRHLAWQTRQIAKGDFEQRVDFLGDFSQSFNTMVDALRESRSQLLAEIRKAEELAELKTRYLNIMAHDIRTPIGAIMGFADMLERSNLGEPEREFARIIFRSSEALLSLIDDLLDFARLEKQQMRLDRTSFSPRELVADLTALMRTRLRTGVTLNATVDDNVPQSLMGDPHRLRQVLVNLLGNAANFTWQGTVHLRVAALQTPSGRMEVTFSVRDTGVGIAADKLDEIFVPFRQAGASTATRYGGSGLGLSISKEIVALMGGELRVRSRLGEGSSFTFSLQMDLAPEVSPDIERVSPRFPVGARIFVVDDDATTRELLSSLLSAHGIDVDTCDDSTKVPELLMHAHREGHPFTLALVDLIMPGIDGLALARELRRLPLFDSLRLVACSGACDELVVPDVAKHFSFVTRKPITQDAIRRILDEACVSADQESVNLLANTRILVVDDNTINRVLVTRLLQKRKAHTSEAENGEIGCQLAERGRFDAIIMDQSMPVLDGIEATRRLRHNPVTRNIPIIGFSADTSDRGDRNMLDAGVTALLHKPVHIDELVSVLSAVIGKKALPETETHA